MGSNLADRLLVLRDEVLDTAERGDGEAPGAEVFDAVVRMIAAQGDTVPGLDLQLHDAIARRLAWGDREEAILADAEAVFARIMKATQRAFRDPGEEVLLAEVTAEVVCGAARIVALAAVARAGRERAARLREELAQRRLKDALNQQKADLARLEASRDDFR
jgi:hypothetical protein